MKFARYWRFQNGGSICAETWRINMNFLARHLGRAYIFLICMLALCQCQIIFTQGSPLESDRSGWTIGTNITENKLLKDLGKIELKYVSFLQQSMYFKCLSRYQAEIYTFGVASLKLGTSCQEKFIHTNYIIKKTHTFYISKNEKI